MFALVVVNLTLWWTSIAIAKTMGVGTPGQYMPRMQKKLMLLTLPAGCGSWILPILLLILGFYPWWEVALATLGSIIIGTITGRLISMKAILLANVISCIFSVIGLIIFLFFVSTEVV